MSSIPANPDSFVSSLPRRRVTGDADGVRLLRHPGVRSRSRSKPISAIGLLSFVFRKMVIFCCLSGSVAIVNGLAGNVFLESARRDHLKFASEALRARIETGIVRKELERLRAPGTVEAWARYNGFVPAELAPVGKEQL